MAHLDPVFGRQYDCVKKTIDARICLYLRNRCLEKTLESSFSVDVDATINIQMEHFRDFIYSIDVICSIVKTIPTLQKVRISEQCRRKDVGGYAYVLQ